ncbi:hypothetical protein ACOSQ2_003413 [Xanthoceras sorbifolium]
MEHKTEVKNLLGQISALMVKCENITDDAVLQTRADLMREYRDGNADSCNVDKAITAWEEIKALAAGEEEEEKALVVNDTQDSQVETSRAQDVKQEQQQQHEQQQ